MIERADGLIELICDDCGAAFPAVMEAGDRDVLLADAKATGWRRFAQGARGRIAPAQDLGPWKMVRWLPSLCCRLGGGAAGRAVVVSASGCQFIFGRICAFKTLTQLFNLVPPTFAFGVERISRGLKFLDRPFCLFRPVLHLIQCGGQGFVAEEHAVAQRAGPLGLARHVGGAFAQRPVAAQEAKPRAKTAMGTTS